MLALGTTGCAERAAGPDTVGPPIGIEAVSCTADVSRLTMRCESATSGFRAEAAGAVTLGGQGLYLSLSNSTPSYNGGSQVFSTTVTLRNLTAQPLGTSDGVNPDPAGIRVFFHSGPAADQGTGPVAVANADGVGDFTGTAQPYFQYDGNLASGATSAAKSWEFSVPPEVTHFAFQVYVTAQLPAPTGVLRWLRDSLGSDGNVSGVAGNTATDVFAVGSFNASVLNTGYVLHWDGSSWAAVDSGADFMVGVWVGGNTVVATGSDGVIWRSDDHGAHWGRAQAAGGALLWSTWGSSANDVYAIGSAGTILHSADGSSWSPMSSGTSQFLNHVWGNSPSDVYAVGFGGTLLHFDGSGWSPRSVPPAFGSTTFYGIGGAGPTERFVVGAGGTILHSTDGGVSWAAQSSGTVQDLKAVWCTDASSCVAVGVQGTALVWNGTAWSPLNSGVSRDLVAVWSASSAAVFAGGGSGVALRGVR